VLPRRAARAECATRAACRPDRLRFDAAIRG
jgi:hypothetical protein